MKKLALAAALTAAFAGSAFAQSSVTLYGRINTTIEAQKDGSLGTKYVLQNNSSRWGLRGSEDLGGGLKALFALENGFASDTGAGSQAGKQFGRDAYVGLQSERLGRVQAGLMTSALYYATADYISNHNHDTGVSADVFYALPNYYNGTTAANVTGFVTNAVQYTTPTFGGFAVTALVSAGEGSATTPKGYEISAVYDSGPLHFGFGYAADEALNGLKNDGFAVRALIEAGPLVYGLLYERNDFQRNVTGQGVGKRNHYRGSVMYVLGASELHANVGRADDIGRTDQTGALQYTVGYNYNLSKRTKVYGFYTVIDNDDNATYGVSNAGDKFSSLALGIRHNF